MKNENELHYMRELAAEVVKVSQAWVCPMPAFTSLGKYSIGAHLRKVSSDEGYGLGSACELVCEAGPCEGNQGVRVRV